MDYIIHMYMIYLFALQWMLEAGRSKCYRSRNQINILPAQHETGGRGEACDDSVSVFILHIP